MVVGTGGVVAIVVLVYEFHVALRKSLSRPGASARLLGRWPARWGHRLDVGPHIGAPDCYAYFHIVSSRWQHIFNRAKR